MIGSECNLIFAAAEDLRRQGEAFVMVTLLATRGHAPQEPGAKALFTAAGLVSGTIGGGKLEARAQREALQLLEARTIAPRLQALDLQKDLGMSCGGSVELLYELFGDAPWSIAIFGAGHVAQALCRVLAPLACRVICVDPRPEWIERLTPSPRLRSKVVSNMAEWAHDLEPGTFCAVITMGHATDLPILEVLLQRPELPFVGSIGSKVKARAIKADLARLGVPETAIQRLKCPIGIGKGARVPEEIAILIAAQLLSERAEQKVRGAGHG